MNIAFPIIKADSGSDIYYRILAAALSRHGIQSEIIELGYAFEFLPGLPRRLRDRLRQFDLVHTNVEYAALFRCPDLPLVSTLHHNVLEPEYQKSTSLAQKAYHRGLLSHRIRASLRHSDALVCVSQATASSFISSFGQHPFRVILNGIDLSRFPRSETVERDPRQLIMVGKLSHRKGTDYILPLMDALGPDFALNCVTRSEGVALERDNIRILSGLDDRQLVEVFRRSGFVISLSRIEGFGYSVAEGMACGCAVVGWNNSALPELCAQDASGQLVEEGDIAAFAAAVTRLARDGQTLAQIGEHNRQRVHSLFSDDAMVEQYIEVYREVLA